MSTKILSTVIVLSLCVGAWFFLKNDDNPKKNVDADDLGYEIKTPVKITKDITQAEEKIEKPIDIDVVADNSDSDIPDWSEKIIPTKKILPRKLNRVTSVTSIKKEFGIPLPNRETLEAEDAMRLATALELCSHYLRDPIESEESLRIVRETAAQYSQTLNLPNYSEQCEGLNNSDVLQAQSYIEYAAENNDPNAMLQFAMNKTMLIDQERHSIEELLGNFSYRDSALEYKNTQQKYLKTLARNGHVGAFYNLAENYWNDQRQVEGLSLLMILNAKFSNSENIKKQIDAYTNELTAVEVDMAIDLANKTLIY